MKQGAGSRAQGVGSREPQGAGTPEAFSAQRLGERVLLARRRRGWTQRELAVQAGLNPVTVARLERGRMPGLSVALAWRLAQALGCSLDTLAGAGAADSEALDAHP